MLDNRLNRVFEGSRPLLSVFFTAGYPFLDSTIPILDLLQEQAVDFVEIGFPFSDPVADGAVIQHSNQIALRNGMTLDVLFSQLKDVRKKIKIPLLLMGYLNPVEQYGYDRFMRSCHDSGIDGLILPDLPPDLFLSSYRSIMEQNNLHNILLVSPTTSEQRIRELDSISTSFLYAVSSTAVTGAAISIDQSKLGYFQFLSGLKLRSPLSIGFGIDSRQALGQVHKYARAGIIGSAFLRAMGEGPDYLEKGRVFLRSLSANG